MPENEMRPPVLHSPLGSIGLAWASAYFLLNVKASLLPSAAGCCAKSLVRPTLFSIPRRQQRPEGPKGGRCLSIAIDISSPKGEQDQGCIFCSAPPVRQHRLCCAWHQWKWQGDLCHIFLCLYPLPGPFSIRIQVWSKFCPDKPSWADVGEDSRVPST